MIARPNIAGYITYHTFSGVHLRPYSGHPDDDFPNADLRAYKYIGERATKVTGYPAKSVFHDFKYEPKQIIRGGSDAWMNHRYFANRGMRPLFVEELAVHPGYQGIGIGALIFEQIERAARLRGCTHIVLDVAENNESALRFYRKRNFYKLDAAIFLAKKLSVEDELMPPRAIRLKRGT